MKRRKFLNIAGGLVIGTNAGLLAGCGGGRGSITSPGSNGNSGGNNSSGNGGGSGGGAVDFSATRNALDKIKLIDSSTFNSSEEHRRAVEQIEGITSAIAFEGDIFTVTDDGITVIVTGMPITIPSGIPDQSRISRAKATLTRSLPTSPKAVLFNGFSDAGGSGASAGGVWSVSDIIKSFLEEAGYQVEHRVSRIDDLMQPFDCGVLYLSGHGTIDPNGIAYICAAKQIGIDATLEVQRLKNIYGLNANPSEPEIAITTSTYEFLGVSTIKITVEEVAFTQNFVKNRTQFSLSDDSIVYLDVCKVGRSAALLDAFSNRSASITIGWNDFVKVGDAYYSTIWLFDRLAGRNKAFPIYPNFGPETTPQRPFDFESLKADMQSRNPRLDHFGPYTDPDNGRSFYTDMVFRANTGEPHQLLPSIYNLQVVPGDLMFIRGQIGNSVGEVFLDGQPAAIQPYVNDPAKPFWYEKALTPDEVVQKGTTTDGGCMVKIPRSFAGPVWVQKDGRKSNVRYLNLWEGDVICQVYYNDSSFGAAMVSPVEPYDVISGLSLNYCGEQGPKSKQEFLTRANDSSPVTTYKYHLIIQGDLQGAKVRPGNLSLVTADQLTFAPNQLTLSSSSVITEPGRKILLPGFGNGSGSSVSSYPIWSFLTDYDPQFDHHNFLSNVSQNGDGRGVVIGNQYTPVGHPQPKDFEYIIRVPIYRSGTFDFIVTVDPDTWVIKSGHEIKYASDDPQQKVIETTWTDFKPKYTPADLDHLSRSA